MSMLTIEEVLRLAHTAGWEPPDLIVAVAVAFAESGEQLPDGTWRANSDARNTTGNVHASVDRGLWQINNFFHNEVTDACAFSPQCCASAAFNIWREAGKSFQPWVTFTNGRYNMFVPDVSKVWAHMQVTPTPTAEPHFYWALRDPWTDIRAIDEFGPETLTGLDQARAFDACGPAALENGAAALEKRDPTYANIGHIRNDMIAHGDWTCSGPACLSNPRTHGCTIEHIAAEIPRRHYRVVDLLTFQDATLSLGTLTGVMEHCRGGDKYAIFIVNNAQAAAGNEKNVHDHFIGVAADDSASTKAYILNSDVAGQHGLATGQWMTLSQLLAADPRGYVIMTRMSPPVTPPPPAETITLDKAKLQAAIDKVHAAVMDLYKDTGLSEPMGM